MVGLVFSLVKEEEEGDNEDLSDFFPGGELEEGDVPLF